MAKKNMTCEESMDRLEEIVSLLENNELSLDKTIELFEEGLKLTKECDAKLKVFEDKVNQIIKENNEDE
ncbi:MAG: exodeoxyribonuclease VII small subunit [Solobacterium sp.]|nr:exodeoxyribonuclease VII small subunit [Solobacterium sp.]